MLKRIVMLLNGLGMARFTQALASLKERLCKRANNLRVSFILVSLSVGNLLRHLVKTLLNFKALLANLIIVVQSIKHALKRAVTTSGPTGQPQATTAPKTRRRARQASKRGK